MNRLTILGGLLGLLLLGCGSTPSTRLGPPPDGTETIRVVQTEHGALMVTWAPTAALWVELRHTETDSLVWRASGGRMRMGVAPLSSPLAYAPMGPPPDVFPPDGRGPDAGAPSPLRVGDSYTVTVAPCTVRVEHLRTVCDALPEQSATFIAVYAGVPDGE